MYNEFPRFRYEGDEVHFLDTDNMDQTILSLVKENQTDVFYFDPVDGFYCYENSIEAQRKMLMPLFEGYSVNEINKNHGCTVCLMPSEKKKGCKGAAETEQYIWVSEIIRRAMSDKSQFTNKENIVFVLNFASRLDACNLREAESNTMFLNLMAATTSVQTSQLYCNSLIMIVDKYNDIPAWVYLNNPNIRTIILSACLHYHLKDLEIWLVDYKQTEFYLYKKKTPPHIKLIGVSKTADFTFSLLDKIESEANRRTELMNRFDAQNLAEYRKHEGEQGYENIPRLFIVIDEFHEMSQFVATEMEYKDKLENILREYRAQGITCLMADQTFSTGLSGLTSAAKNQIGLRIAMRNEASPQEIKDTLEVDRAMYSDSMQRTIAIMSQGEFIMKVYVRNNKGELTDIKLEKFKGLFTKGDDIVPISKALRSLYKGQYTKDLLYVNTKEQVGWDDSEPMALDQIEPLRYPNIRLYLGRSATLRPCFGLDIGRQPDENLAIVGGTAYQRWELIASIMKSCCYRNYMLFFLNEKERKFFREFSVMYKMGKIEESEILILRIKSLQSVKFRFLVCLMVIQRAI